MIKLVKSLEKSLKSKINFKNFNRIEYSFKLKRFWDNFNHMLKLLGFIVSILLILIIFLRMPQENVGLSSFATKSDMLGSPSSAEKSLNILTALGIIIYMGIALELNFILTT